MDAEIYDQLGEINSAADALGAQADLLAVYAEWPEAAKLAHKLEAIARILHKREEAIRAATQAIDGALIGGRS